MAPSTPGAARPTDVGQVALCALLLAGGRPLDQNADIADLPPLVREVTELAEIRAGSSFAQGVGRFFGDTLPSVSPRQRLGADEATAEIRRLLTYISEDESLNALAELVSYRPAARPVVAAVHSVTPVRTVAPPRPVPAPPVATKPTPTPVAAAPPRPMPAAAVAAAPMPAISVPVIPVSATTPPVATAAVIPVPLPAAPLVPEPPVVEELPPAPVLLQPVAPPMPVAPFIPQPRANEQEESVAPAIAAWTPPTAPAWTPPPPPVPVPVPQPPVQPVQQRVPVGPPLLTPVPVGPVRTPAHLASQAPPAILKIREEKPAGYAPIRVKEESIPEAEPTARALSFLDRAASEREGGFPWKIAAAAVLVLLVGAAAGRDYFLSRADPPADAPAASPAAAPWPASTTTGGLVIDSQPSGAKVTLDGKDVGITPLTIEAVKPGRHQVTITSGGSMVQRSVRIEAGKEANINVPVFSGWVAIFAPIRLEVSEGRRSLGSTDESRIMLPPGKHVLTFSSAEFGYKGTQTVEISPGEERVLNLRPTGTVNLNASPWAEVWVDGTRAGETPLANLEVPLGTREFVFKHPQYGERKLTATVTTTTSALSVDFGRPPSKP